MQLSSLIKHILAHNYGEFVLLKNFVDVSCELVFREKFYGSGWTGWMKFERAMAYLNCRSIVGISAFGTGKGKFHIKFLLLKNCQVGLAYLYHYAMLSQAFFCQAVDAKNNIKYDGWWNVYNSLRKSVIIESSFLPIWHNCLYTGRLNNI